MPDAAAALDQVKALFPMGQVLGYRGGDGGGEPLYDSCPPSVPKEPSRGADEAVGSIRLQRVMRRLWAMALPGPPYPLKT